MIDTRIMGLTVPIIVNQIDVYIYIHIYIYTTRIYIYTDIHIATCQKYGKVKNLTKMVISCFSIGSF